MAKAHRATAIRKPHWLILLLVTFGHGCSFGLGCTSATLPYKKDML
jgi:hypothetical protein